MPKSPILFAMILAFATVTPLWAHGASAADGVRVVALFGESDEEKAARQQHEDNQDLEIQALTQRVHDLEESLRQLTGQNEQLVHQIQLLNDRIDRQQRDFDYRLCAMAAQQLGASTAPGDENALPCPAGTGSAQAAPSAGPPGPGPSQPLGRPPGTLGTLPANGSPGSAPGNPNAHAQYDAGMNLLAKAQYDEATAAFRSFADQNPADPLAATAVYWIGRIAYVQKDYAGAARAFAEVIKKHPTSPVAAESLLKLGQSLLAAGQKAEGCTALVALKKKYPHAAKNLIQEAASAHKEACKR